MVKLVIQLTENDVTFTALNGASSVSVALYDMSTKAVVLLKDSSDPNVTLNDPEVGSISWQILSTDTVGLNSGKYGLAVQVKSGTSYIEWDDGYSVNLVNEIITNS